MTAVHIVDLGRSLPRYVKLPYAEVRSAELTAASLGVGSTMVAVKLHGVHSTIEFDLSPQGTTDHSVRLLENTDKTARDVIDDLMFIDADVDIVYCREDYKSPWVRTVGVPPTRRIES